ncbi:xanthine dehydrogenase family protein molybdopterin-binding subunit [Alphaproteobacteria bacterium]|nr:xanthine dehydrogenase family protein molybdopterin-binding subunit [Alphaproteobacteria bacterium]
MPDGSATGIGVSVKRKEDYRFLVGEGNYTDDINRPNQTYSYMFRSNTAHANFKIDVKEASNAKGVVKIFLGTDMEVGSIPCGWQVDSKDGTPMREPAHPPIAKDKVRYVGEILAVIIAESIEEAKNAAELIEVNFDEKPVIINMNHALDSSKGLVHDEIESNVCYDWEIGDSEAVDTAMSKAAHITSLDIRNNRLIPNAMETRAAIGDYVHATGDYTLYTTSQNPHVIRLLMGAFVLGLPEHKLRVIAPDVGGGFGSKIFHYAEEAIVTWASNKIRRPVKWTSDRSEAFISDAHGRDHVTSVKLALDKDGKFLALKVDTLANMGAYLSTFASSVPTYLYATLLAGTYTTPAIHCNVKSIFTNTVPVDAYRGAGRPEATYLIERIVDKAAREMGISQVDLRRKNFIPVDAFPYQTPVALQYDSGNYTATLDTALKKADYDGFSARKAASAKNGMLRGIGFSTYLEACGIAPSAVVGSLGARAGLFECAEVRVHPTGSVTVFTGSHSHGQGHETTFAQLVSDKLGISTDMVEISHGDTNNIPFGMGTYGSRSLAVGGEAIAKAMDKVVAKAKKIAAHIMEASADDIELNNGNFEIAGTDKSMSLAEISLAAYVPHNYPHDELEPGLDEKAFYDPLNFTYPGGCHICEVEINPNTGEVKVEGMTAIDDVGKVINPMIVEGQVHGGLAQGIGQALLENAAYDDNGQLLSGSYMDYTMPRADDLVNFNVGNEVTLCTHNSLGVKGCGEVGAIGSPPAVINAVVDALSELGVDDISMPATPEKIWNAINNASKK